MKNIALAALCSSALLLLQTSVGLSADTKHGLDLAQRWCASCHIVVPNQAKQSSEAPPFATVARKPRFDEKQLAFYLLLPHPRMPNMSLTRNEATDLAAYIATLAK